MVIYPARPHHAEEVHALGLRVPELKVSATADFMSLDEVHAAIIHPTSVFLLAHVWTSPRSSDGEETLIGFIYAHVDDTDAPIATEGERFACFVYLAVEAVQRHLGVATALYDEAVKRLKRDHGVTHVYAWAHPSSGVIKFMQRQGFAAGKTCVWMDKKL